MSKYNKQGFAMVTALLLLVVLAALVASYFALTSIETATETSSRNSTTAFYAAEAGLNVRATEIRRAFEDFNVPFGTSPSSYKDCLTGSNGSGDFACNEKTFSGHKVLTYVYDETQGVSNDIIIPPGERFAGLFAQEFVYTTYSTSVNKQDFPEANLALRFKNRLIPIFQFMAFYNKDLEFASGSFLETTGPVHANGDLYLNVGGGTYLLHMLGSTSVSKYDPNLPSAVTPNYDGGNLYRGSKLGINDPWVYGCNETVKIATIEGDSTSLVDLDCNGLSPRRLVPKLELATTWPETISVDNEPLEVPPPGSFLVQGEYWNSSDLRIVFNVNSNVVEVRNQANVLNTALTAVLNGCDFIQNPTGAFNAQGTIGTGPVTVSTGFRERREGTYIAPQLYTMINVDIQALLVCIDTNTNSNLLSLGPAGGTVGLADSTNGGLAFYFTVNAANPNGFGVRFYNGASLSNTNTNLQGLTLVTNLPSYVQGDFNLGQFGTLNANNWRPAAIFADTFNILSSSWRDNSGILDCANQAGIGIAPATPNTTEVNVAVISGTDTSGNVEGSNGWQSAANSRYSGGLHNYPRYHENWSPVFGCLEQTVSYRGSFVTLGRPNIASGQWQCCGANSYYSAPTRDYGFDSRFRSVLNLPPLTPNVVYLSQELFERSFDEGGFN